MAVKASFARFSAAAVLLIGVSACDLIKKKDSPTQKTREEQLAAAREEAVKEACASPGTFNRLKEIAFDQAVRIRNADPANLDTLAAHSVVRMEEPVVKSRDEDLNITVCSGRFVLELPPGAEDAFDGDRRLVADIEYAAQAAADRSGLVYQMSGAEPIVYRLAAFDLQGRQLRVPGEPAEQQYAEAVPIAPPAPASEQPSQPRPQAQPAPRARPEPKVRTVQRPAQPAPTARRPAPKAVARVEKTEPTPRPVRRANPSFNCRYAKTRSEQMVCTNGRLAARDRQMSSMFYSALSDARPRTRRELRRSRDRFLAYRERCRSEACVADAYQGRMEEIRDIMAED
jgi:hypothetical protein